MYPIVCIACYSPSTHVRTPRSLLVGDACVREPMYTVNMHFLERRPVRNCTPRATHVHPAPTYPFSLCTHSRHECTGRVRVRTRGGCYACARATPPRPQATRVREQTLKPLEYGAQVPSGRVRRTTLSHVQKKPKGISLSLSVSPRASDRALLRGKKMSACTVLFGKWKKWKQSFSEYGRPLAVLEHSSDRTE